VGGAREAVGIVSSRHPRVRGKGQQWEPESQRGTVIFVTVGQREEKNVHREGRCVTSTLRLTVNSSKILTCSGSLGGGLIIALKLLLGGTISLPLRS